MRRRLPSVGALEAFEAVARLGSATRAADERARTQSAVSRQIARLESFARRPLFDRDQKRLVLNDAGRFFAEHVPRILNDLEFEVSRLIAFGNDEKVLRVGVLPTFGSHWLMPRLAGYSAHDIKVELHLVKGLGREDFERQGVDVSIECMIEPPRGLRAHHLVREEVVAVISPDLYARSQALEAPIRLTMPARPELWQRWQSVHPGLRTGSEVCFENYGMLIEAACLGYGVAVLPSLYAAKDLAAGRLIAPFGKPVPSGRSYWLIYPNVGALRPKVAHFVQWLLATNEDTAPSPEPAFA